MKGSSVHKAENGKMLKIALEYEKGKVLGIRISGDFFMHPEESITVLENRLKGTELDEERLGKKAASIVEENSIQLFGFEAKDLAKAIMEAVQ